MGKVPPEVVDQDGLFTLAELFSFLSLFLFLLFSRLFSLSPVLFNVALLPLFYRLIL